MKIKRKYLFLGILFLLISTFIFLILNSKHSIFNKEESKTNPSQTSPSQITNSNPSFQTKTSSLTTEERERVQKAILSSEFIKDLPRNGIISLKFFTFEDGQRVWLDRFLIGKNQILNSGEPDISLTLHSKYISELTEDNLCEVIPRANVNGDLGTYSDESDSKLLLKYSGMLKYRDCFGF